MPLICSLCLSALLTVRPVACRYGNIFGEAREYAKECMLICPVSLPLACLPIPVMSHQRNKYKIDRQYNVKCLRQLRVQHEDFVSPSSKQTPK